jgi:L-aspartate oxidase
VTAELDDIIVDVLVIGSGAAGGACALAAAAAGRQVGLITKAGELRESNTFHAQGGVVGRPPDDRAEDLAADILEAGDGLCHPPAVRLLAESVPAVTSYLIDRLGVEFSREPGGQLDFTQEAAHLRRRIMHADDATGAAIEEKLVAAVRAEPRIHVLTGRTAVDLITVPHHSVDPLAVYENLECLGAYVLDIASGGVQRLFAAATVLATGGLGQIFLHTTNPRVARGDGLAMAARAGATIINAEYIQFHPTAFYHRDADRFLISESLRGEGARLRTKAGKLFLEDYHPLGDLAPRDVVARAIHEEMLASGDEYVLLDLSFLQVDPKVRFPTIYETCRRFGVDITREPIPVVPAAHYFCGGIRVDLWGRTDIKNLYAVGEVACTGVHGANRLASTSLLEGLLWGQRAGEDAARAEAGVDRRRLAHIAPWHDAGLTEEIDPLLIVQDWMNIKTTMWNYAGIVRTSKRLDRAVADLTYLEHRIDQFYRETRLADELVGLRNAMETALIVARSARRNRRSRGCHFRRD